MAHYVGGLHQPLQDFLSHHTLWNVSEAYQRALAIEKQKNRRSSNWSDKNQRSIRPLGNCPAQPTQQNNPNPTIRCFRCGEQGHQAENCRTLTNQKGKNLLIEEESGQANTEDEETMYDEERTSDVLYGDV